MITFDTSKLVNLKKHANGSYTAQCPICALDGHDKTNKNHLIIYPNNAFNCIKAGADDKAHNKAIRKFLLDGQSLEGTAYEFVERDTTVKIDMDKIYPEDTLNKLIKNYQYWENRGVNSRVIELLEGGVSSENEKSKLSGRFIFPIRDRNRQIIGFTGRIIKENNFSPKWKHLFKTSKVCWPWNITGQYIKQHNCVILVESVGDLLALLSNNVYNVICIFGLNLNSEVIGTLIANNIKKIVISLNNDKDMDKGNGAALKLKEKLKNFFLEENIIIRLPISKDWGEASKQEIEDFKNELGI